MNKSCVVLLILTHLFIKIILLSINMTSFIQMNLLLKNHFMYQANLRHQ